MRNTLSCLLLFVLLSLSQVTCATGAGARGSKYPPRPANCKIALYHTLLPGVPAYDDLGSADVACPLDMGKIQCLQRLRAAACRMGGDLLYDVPTTALRPTEQGIAYHGRVAHTRAAPPGKSDESAGGKSDGDAPPPASEEESRGPVIPLGAPAAAPEAPPPSDGGAPPDGATP
jgi:hypothetical protein